MQLTGYLNDHGGEFYETSSWQYSFYAPHDMATLVHLMGGRKKFTQRLDTLLSDAGYHDIGNEPGFMHAYLYNYAGAPAKTVDHVLGILNANFTTEIDGLPGNDDVSAHDPQYCSRSRQRSVRFDGRLRRI